MVTTIATEGVGVSEGAPVDARGPVAPERSGSPVSAVPSTPAVEFDRFCREEFAAVTGLAFVLTGSWTAAEDLAQEAFFAAFRRWDELRDYDKPGAWVRRVVANRAVSWRRRIHTEARALARLGTRNRADAAVTEIPERHAEVWAAVRRLPPRQAQVFALTYVEDLPVARVAAILDISADTAKTHLRRARAALAASGPDGADPQDTITADIPAAADDRGDER